MLDFNPLFEFSRNHCIAICAFLVPANLATTLHTLIRVGFHQVGMPLRAGIQLAIAAALLMVLHVATWLMVGVVMAPTFILLWLGVVCLCINGWAIVHPSSLRTLLHHLTQKAQQILEGRAIAPVSSNSSVD